MARQKDLRAMVLLPVLLAVILAALDCQMAGVLYRYLSDYLTPLLFAAALVWLWAESALAPLGAGRRIGQHPAYRAAHAAGGDAGSCCRGDLLQLLCLLCCGTGLLGQNPALYQNVSRLVQFWL